MGCLSLTLINCSSLPLKRELAALRQHDGETMEQLVTAREKIRKLTGMIEEVRREKRERRQINVPRVVDSIERVKSRWR